MVWLDEWAFIGYNQSMYEAMRPAVSTAARIAKKNGTPYGILITTTPKPMYWAKIINMIFRTPLIAGKSKHVMM